MATPKLSAIGLLSIGGETTFGVEAGNLVALRCYPVDLSGLTVDTIVDEHQRQGDYGVARIPGVHTGSITTKHNFFGFSSYVPEEAVTRLEATEALATAYDQLLAVLASAFGYIYSGGYATGSPTTLGGQSLNLPNLSSFAVGGPVIWDTTQSRRPYELGWFTDIDQFASPDEGTLLGSYTMSPTGSGGLWGGHTMFVRDGDPYHELGAKSWTLRFAGHATDYYVTCFGCQPTGVKIMCEAGKIPTFEITWGVAHWTTANSGGAPGVAAWDYPQPEPATKWRVSINSTEQSIRSFEFDLGLTRSPIAGGAGASGIEGWFTSTRKPTVKFQVYRDYNTEIVAFDGQNSVTFEAQWGSQPGKMFGLCLPRGRIVEFPKATDRDGGVVSEIVLEGQYYASDNSNQLTIPANSPARLLFA